MCEVCGTLTDMWHLRVLCPYMKNPDDPCIVAYMHAKLRALSVCMHRANGRSSCIAHPSAFDAQWYLQLGPRLHSS